MTLGMAWLLCLVGTPVSIGVMILITKAKIEKIAEYGAKI